METLYGEIQSATEINENPVIYCPYVPLFISKMEVKSKPRKLKTKCTVEMSNEMIEMHFSEEAIDKWTDEAYMKELREIPFIHEEEFRI